MLYIYNTFLYENENGPLLTNCRFFISSRQKFDLGAISHLEKLGYKYIQMDLPLKPIWAMQSSHFKRSRKTKCCVFQQWTPMTNHSAFQEIKTTLDLLEVWSRSKGMGEGEQEEIRTNNLLHIHCVQKEQTERELAVLEEVGCKSVL